MDENYDLKIALLQKAYPDEDFEDIDESDLNELIYEHYGIDLDVFDTLIEDLLPFCTIAKSELTGKWYRGFGDKHLWLRKQEIK